MMFCLDKVKIPHLWLCTQIKSQRPFLICFIQIIHIRVFIPAMKKKFKIQRYFPFLIQIWLLWSFRVRVTWIETITKSIFCKNGQEKITTIDAIVFVATPGENIFALACHWKHKLSNVFVLQWWVFCDVQCCFVGFVYVWIGEACQCL
jgi:hypothetical protein